MNATAKRFADKITFDCVGSCWNWRAATSRGYGVVRVDGVLRKAHRVMFASVHGCIPSGLHVMHTCDNPRCVNPAHLRVGTHADNMRDMARKERAGRTLVSAASATKAREAHAQGATIRSLAAIYGVAESTMRSVLIRETRAFTDDLPARQFKRRLTGWERAAILEMSRDGKEQAEIAEHFGIHQSSVSRVLSGGRASR